MEATFVDGSLEPAHSHLFCQAIHIMLFASTSPRCELLLVILFVGLLGCSSETEPPGTTTNVSVKGAVKVLTERHRSVAPNDGLESDSVFFLIPEKQRYELTAPVSIDARDPDNFGGSAELIDDSLAAGTRVDSYLLHFDKVGSSNSDIRLQGELRVPGRLLGLITSGDHLDASDGQLGVPGIHYPQGGSRRASEIGRTGDRVVIGPDRRTLTLDLITNVSADHIRILTAAE